VENLRSLENGLVLGSQDSALKIYRLRILLLSIVVVLTAGCSALGPRATSTPIFVTATSAPVAELPTSTTESTAVFGPTQDPNATPVMLPTIGTATTTPIPSLPPSLTPTFTATYTESPEPRRTAAVRACTTVPQGGFATIYNRDAALKQALGCPVSAAVAINSAVQQFDNGRMVWASQLADAPTKVIYVVYNNNTFQRYTDSWIEGADPESTGEIAPPGRVTPIRGFGKVWHNNASVKNGLGWAAGPEAGTPGQIQRFERGEMLFVASIGQTFVFIGSGAGTWRTDGTPF
jgi:serine/threonine-protein kinase